MSPLKGFLVHYGGWFVAASVASLLLGLVLTPYLIVRIPVDYFSAERHSRAESGMRHPALRLAWAVARNVVGAVFVVAGVLMLVLPGQGVLTLLIGLMIMDYPGKAVLLRRIAGQRQVLRGMNWLRARAGRPPLEPPPGGAA